LKGRSTGQPTRPENSIHVVNSDNTSNKNVPLIPTVNETEEELLSFRNRDGKLTICNIQAQTTDHTSIKVELIKQDVREGSEADGMVDSGATDEFVDEGFVEERKFPRVKLDRAIPVYNVDGTPNILGSISEKCELTMRYGDHYETIRLYITKLGKKKIILGHTWLTKHNPEIDWVTGDIKMTRCQEECGRGYPRDEFEEEPRAEKEVVFGLDARDEVSDFKIYNAQLGLWDTVESIPRFYLNASTTKSTEIAAGSYVEKSFEEAVPAKYHQYRKVFEEIPTQHVPPRRPWDHAIELRSEMKPSKLTKAYPISPKEQVALDEFLDENLKSGRIRPSKSPWASGFFFVNKKDGKLRPVQDYRALNNATVKNAYPLPLISEMIPKLQKAKYFTKLDVRWGFNNIRIREGDEEKAAFLTNRGLFEPTVMFFGLCNSPATFQTMMNEILRTEIQRGSVMAYMDDVLIFTEMLEEQEAVTKRVLEVMRDNDLYLKPGKCEFEKKEVEYLGLVVGNGEVKMDPRKLGAISEWPEPKTVKEIQSFLGFCNFYRNFINKFATTARPLWDLTKKTKEWKWGVEERHAFQKLKNDITSQPVLSLPNFEDPFRVEADASDYATGAVLSQRQKDIWKPVAFLSKALTHPERNYEIHDRELLAIIRALEEWRQFLQGAKHQIEILTDHKNLEYFLSARKLNRRQARWSGRLADYDYVLKHKPGSSMGKPDALSRRPDHREGMEDDNTDMVLITAKHIASLRIRVGEAITTESMGDQVLDDLRKLPIPTKAKADKETWETKNGLAYRGGLVVVADDEVKRRILGLAHDLPVMGHPGQQKTHEIISRDFFWYKMTADINKYVKGCRKCQQTKIFPEKPQGELHPNEIPSKPFQIVSVDFLTDLPPSQGYDSIMIVVDRFSKRIYTTPCNKTINSEGTARLFKDVVWRYEGLPETVISDRGPQFVSEFTRELYKLLGIKQNLSTAAHAQTDGQTERVNQEIEQYFRIFINAQMNDWAAWLPIAEHCYNNRVHSATGVSPFFATRGYEVNTSVSPTRQQPQMERFEEFAQRMSKVREEAECALKKAAKEMKKFYDRGRKPKEYSVGDRVWLEATNLTTDRPKKKLDHKRLGPFKIIQKISNVVYKLELPPTWRIHPVFHVSKLRRYTPDPYGRALPRVTLHVRGDNWEASSILHSRLQSGRLEYLVLWKLPEGNYQELWELESRMSNDAPEKVKLFHRNHPSAPRRLSSTANELLP
jgi:hypothetical protein